MYEEKLLLKAGILANRDEKSRANGCVYDPTEILGVDVARLTFGFRREERPDARIARANRTRVCRRRGTAGGVRKTATETRSRTRQASRKNTRSLGDASSVLVVANGISNASRDGRFSMGASSSYTTSLRARERIFGAAPANTAVNCGNRSVTPSSRSLRVLSFVSLRGKKRVGVAGETTR